MARVLLSDAAMRGGGGYPGLPGILADPPTHQIRRISLRGVMKL